VFGKDELQAKNGFLVCDYFPYFSLHFILCIVFFYFPFFLIFVCFLCLHCVCLFAFLCLVLMGRRNSFQIKYLDTVGNVVEVSLLYVRLTPNNMINNNSVC